MNGDRPKGDTRCHAERQADALVVLARRALDDGTLPDVRRDPRTSRWHTHHPDGTQVLSRAGP
jgi:hypothetical protein